jgi:hypothetical protein
MSARVGARAGLCVAAATVKDRERTAMACDAGKLLSTCVQARRASMVAVVVIGVGGVELPRQLTNVEEEAKAKKHTRS